MTDKNPLLSDVPFIPRGVRLHFDKVRDLWVLLAPERTINLDPIGLAILREIDGTSTLSQIAENLSARYNAPVGEITSDISEFIVGLMDRRILEVRA